MKQGIKKAVVGLLAVSMVASVGAVSAFAAGTGRNFADADGNGVCDNYSVEKTVSRAAGALQKGSGQNFVDADNDGICVNYAVGQETGQETPVKICSKAFFIAALYRWMKFWNSLQRCGKTIKRFWKRYYRSRRNTGKSYISIIMKDIPHRRSERF